MPKYESRVSKRFLTISVACVIIVAALAVGLWLQQKKEKTPFDETPPEKIRVSVKPQPVIDYNKLEKDLELKRLMEKRKAEYGMGQGIDMIVRSDESVKIGDATVPMQEVLEKIKLNSGDIVENDIDQTKADAKPAIQTFGIHVVRSGDNIWNIHFKFLKDYFDYRGVNLSPLADEPDNHGYSSGIGKILKFSENIVHIYNIKDKQFEVDLNLILPLNKIVVYNMDQVFTLLNQIDYSQVNRIMFDGDTIWIPAEQ
jgi:hypothetical protein